MRSPTPLPARAPRADAQRNRERLLVAAEEVFTERGADASLEEIAKRASVGIGTLYRHFPTREALLGAACDARLVELAEHSHAREPSTGPTAETFSVFLQALVGHASAYRGLATSLGIVLKNGGAGCRATTAEGTRLLEGAQRAGHVRLDVDFEEIVTMAAAIALAAESSEGTSRVDRLFEIFVDGLRVPAEPKGRPRARRR